MTHRSALESDWKYLSLALEDLEGYLLSPERIWLIHEMVNDEHADRARLTIGGIRLCQARLGAAPLTAQHQAELTRLGFAIDRLQVRWQVHWLGKAEHENEERSRLWQNFLNDLKEECWSKAIYASQVRMRAMLELLNDELAGSRATYLPSTFMDEQLRWSTQEGPFVWEPEIEAGFTGDKWWFLYRTERKKR